MSSLVIYENKSKLKSSKSTLVCALGTLYNLESHIKILPHFNMLRQLRKNWFLLGGGSLRLVAKGGDSCPRGSSAAN